MLPLPPSILLNSHQRQLLQILWPKLPETAKTNFINHLSIVDQDFKNTLKYTINPKLATGAKQAIKQFIEEISENYIEADLKQTIK